MALENVLSALLPLLRDGESATITKSPTTGSPTIIVEGGIEKACIYDEEGTYEWYSHTGRGAWAADNTDAMTRQLLAMLDCARTSPTPDPLRGRETQELTPGDPIKQSADTPPATKSDNRKEAPMSPLSRARLLMPLLEAVRSHLGCGEWAAFRRTTYGSLYIEARTERGNMTASIDKDGLYVLDAAGSRYACDPNGTKGAIHNAIRQALNDAREEWT